MSIDIGGDYNGDPGSVGCGFVPGVGPSHPQLALIGEAPAKNEIKLGVPFCGPAGQYLDSICRRVALPPRELIYISNLLKVPAIDNEDDKMMEAQTREWDWMLHAELAERKPKVVASLGAWSTRWFISNYSPGYPDTTDMDWLHGIPRKATAPWGEFILVPCFHPAAGLHDAESVPKIYADLTNLRKVLAGTLPVLVDKVEHEYEWIDDRRQFPYDATHLAVDTESVGLHGAIKLVSMSDRIGYGGVIRSRDVMMQFVRWLHNDFRGTLIMHNMPHDLQILEQVGLNTHWLHQMTLADTMLLCKYFNTETNGLKAQAYRLLGVTMNEYADIVRPVQRQFAIEYLEMLNTIDYPKPPEELVWKKGEPKVYKPQNLNRRIANIQRDLTKDPNIDVLKRWKDIPDSVVKYGIDVFGPMREANIEDVDPELAKTYSGQDADVTLMLYWESIRRLKDMYGSEVDVK